MITRTPIEVLRRLIEALPKCCGCEKDVAVVMNDARFWLCEKCWKEVPSSDFKPVYDLRSAIYAALILLARNPTSLQSQ